MSNDAPKVNQVKIKIDGELLPHEIMAALAEVEVDTSISMPHMFTIKLHDDHMELVNSDTFDLGKSVEILFAEQGSTSFKSVVTGEITAIEAQFGGHFSFDSLSVLMIQGYDRSHRLNRGTKTRVFIQMSDSDIVKQICNENGLAPKVDDTSQVHDHVFQDNQTDLAFLQYLAQRNGYEMYVNARELNFRKHRGTVGTAGVDLDWGRKLKSFQTRLTTAGQVDEVLVKGWDAIQKKEIVGSASSSKSAPGIQVGGSGGDVASKAFSSAKYMEVQYPVTTQKQAEDRAQAILDSINASFVEASGVADGDPSLVAGTTITVKNLGQKYTGSYILTSAVHEYSPDAGYMTRFTIEGSERHTLSDLVSGAVSVVVKERRWGGVVPAIVTNIDDPEQLGRVKIMYPWLDTNLESHWARVVGMGGGDQRGFLILPEVGDEVLVAFEQSDFNHPYVLGGLWSSVDKPPIPAVKNGKTQVRELRSREGHIIRLVDDPSDQKIEIVDAKEGTSIVLSSMDNSLTIKSKGDITIETDANMTLKALAIDIEAQTSVNVNGITAKVDASAQLELKGGMVMIN